MVQISNFPLAVVFTLWPKDAVALQLLSSSSRIFVNEVDLKQGFSVIIDLRTRINLLKETNCTYELGSDLLSSMRHLYRWYEIPVL